MIMTAIAPPIDAALLDRVEGLASTAEYIVCLHEIVQRVFNDLTATLRRKGDDFAGETRDWQQIEMLLNLATSQADIVRDVARDVEAARLAFQ